MKSRNLPAALAVVLTTSCANAPPAVHSPPPADDTIRLTEQLARCQQLQREEKRKLDQLGHQLREERRKSDEMQQKIDSLRTIDREMNLRRKLP